MIPQNQMKKKIKIIIIILVALLLIGDICYYFFYPKTASIIYKEGDIKKVSTTYATSLPKINFFINDKQFLVEVAQSDAQKSLGLSDREGLNQNAGMLFIFNKPSKQYFWMKDMKFPIDIVWIDENKKIVGLVENAKPEDYPETYPSPQNVVYVLEIGSGEVKKQGIKIGDGAIFDLLGTQNKN